MKDDLARCNSTAAEISLNGREVSALETWPAHIYLTAGNKLEDFEMCVGVTWSVDGIGAADVRYVRADRLAKLEALHEAIKDWIDGATNCFSEKITDALEDLEVAP